MKTTIEIQNLKCGGCANTIKNKLSEIKGVTEVAVDVEKSEVTFITDNAEQVIEVKNKLTAIGYPEVGEDNSIVSKAKSFVSCATGKMNV